MPMRQKIRTLQMAIDDINRKEKKPIKYLEKIPGKDFSNVFFSIAAVLIALLLGVKIFRGQHMAYNITTWFYSEKAYMVIGGH